MAAVEHVGQDLLGVLKYSEEGSRKDYLQSLGHLGVLAVESRGQWVVASFSLFVDVSDYLML